MLSKVLTGRDAAEAAPFIAADAGSSARPQPVRPGFPAPAAAMAEAVATIQRLEAELVNARRQALEAGRAEGEQRARADLEPVLARMNASIVELAGMRSEMRRRAERDVVQLALLIAKRILHRELSVDENAIAALARVAFEKLARAESYRVALHPRFANAVAAAVPPGIAVRVRVEPDPALEPGTLVIHSPEGSIDASIDTQLEEIGRGLTDRLEGGAGFQSSNGRIK
jgi:flagellar assembly protein FliH